MTDPAPASQPTPTEADHTIAWTIETGDFPRGVVTCRAAVGADCRTWCTAGCDEHCPLEDPETGEPHPQADTGACLMVAGLNTGTWGRVEESYDGDKVTVHDGPISIRWSAFDEAYLWSYVTQVVQ